MRYTQRFCGAMLIVAGSAARGWAVEPAGVDAPVTLATVVDPGENSPEEPLAEKFALARGKHFLDSASLAWQKNRDCLTCHTNYLYLMARPALGADDAALRTVRQYAEELVTRRWPQKGPRWDAEVVMTALVLASGDTASGKLQPATEVALDRMWTVQQADGGFQWIDCDWPPFESDHEFGGTMAALAVSIAPEKYADTPAATAGIARLRQYLSARALPSLHHRLMLLWADTYRPGWLAPGERTALVEQLLALQLADGGWSAATLGDWKRGDGKQQAVGTSDGYGTGLAVYLARRAGIAADDTRLVRGVGWIKSHQRASGRWFTRSLFKDNKHYLTHAGSSMAILALAACDALHD